MIAVNIMRIDLKVIPGEYSAQSALEVFRQCRVDVLPVVDSNAMMLGVLRRERFLKAMCGESGRRQSKTLRAADICETDFVSIGPEAAISELRGLLSGGAVCLFVVDKGARLLGSISEAELTSRLKEYEKIL